MAKLKEVTVQARHKAEVDGKTQDVTTTYTMWAESEQAAQEIIVARAASRGGWNGEWV